jgi:formate hydrogenlyase subunit 3/multisubunit Na+/H+ antiporter MnhD subunit
MIRIIFGLSPIISLFVCAIVSLASSKNIRSNLRIGQFGIIIALILNSIHLFFFKEIISYNSLLITSANTSIIEIILFFGLVIFSSISTNLKKSHTEFFIAANYLLFLAGIIGIFLSNNFIIITLFTILTTTSLGILFYFGPYKKKVTSLNRYFLILVVSALCLLILCFMGYIIFQSMDVMEWQNTMASKTGFIQGLFFILLLFGFGMICGLFPIINIQFEEYFRQSNPVNLRLITAIFFPVFGLFILQILVPMFKSNIGIGSLGYFISLFGTITAACLLIIELFGKNQSQSQSVFKILGLSSILDFHIILFLGFSAMKSVPESLGTILDAIILFILIIMAVKSIWIDSFGPIFNTTDDLNLRQIGGFFRYYPKFIVFLFFIPLIISLPFLPGSYVLTMFIESFTTGNLLDPMDTAQLWISLVVYIAYIGVIFVIIASMINEIFFGKSELTQSEIIPKIESKFYIGPIVISIFLIILTIREIIGFNLFFPSISEIRSILFNI